NQIYELAKNSIFSSSHGQPPVQIQLIHGEISAVTQPWIGLSQPPRKNNAIRKLIRIMFAYSARKNSANAPPEYSTMCPATISDSPSTTSNGARLVSATPETQYTTNSGNNGSRNQSNRPESPFCASTMSVRFRLPAAIITPMSAKPMAIS